jgi:hypothetical protein
VWGAYWREPVGKYRVSVRLAAEGPVNVEVWNATGNHLLVRHTLVPTLGIATQSLVVNNPKRYPPHLDHGIGLFSLQPLLGPQINNNLEVRVWTPGNIVADVYSVTLQRMSSH